MNRKDLEFKKEWLQWLLDFIQIDLSSMPMSKVKKICLEASFNTSDSVEIFAKDEFKMVGFETDLFDIEKISKLQTGLRQFLEMVLNMALSKKDESIELPQTTSFLRVNEYPDVSHEDSYKWKRDFDITPILKENNRLNETILRFSQFIDGLGVHSIMKCRGCGRFFLNLTRKVKIYCTSTCASRSIAHKRYEDLKKDPKKYIAHLKKYRKYSSDRYWKLRKLQFGPNVRKNRKEG